jgi:hypothetical protein
LRPKRLEPPRVVKLLAMAVEWQRQIDAGEVQHRAEISHRQGLSRARVTQILNLLKLHPTIQDYVRNLTPDTPERLVTERKLRRLAKLDPGQQLEAAQFMFSALKDSAQFAADEDVEVQVSAEGVEDVVS